MTGTDARGEARVRVLVSEPVPQELCGHLGFVDGRCVSCNQPEPAWDQPEPASEIEATDLGDALAALAAKFAKRP